MKLNTRITKSLFCLLLLVMFFLVFPIFESNAATLSSVYVVLSRMQANLTSSDNLEMYIGFETTGTIPSGCSIVIQFPDDDDGNWCRVGGSDLTVSGVNSTPADSTGAYSIDASLPGTLSCACSQGSGAGSVDTITISGISSELNNATGTYGVKISNGSTAKLGTSSTTGNKAVTMTVSQGATSETKSFTIDLVSSDQVTVTATVEEPPTVTCTLSTNAVNLGDLYAGGTYVTGTHTVSAYTSDNAAGYYWVVYGRGNSLNTAGLYKSSATTYLIESDDDGGSTMDISTPGSEGFGLNVNVDDENAIAGTGFSHTDNGNGVYGTLGYSQDNAEILLYKNWGAQTSSSTYTVIYGARAGSSAVPGSYTEVVTFVCGGYYGGDSYDPYNWTLDYDDIFGSYTAETSAETIPVDASLYLAHTISSGDGAVSYRKNVGSLVSWANNTTVSFSANDTLSIYVEASEYSEGDIELKLGGSSGRTISSFSYTIEDQAAPI